MRSLMVVLTVILVALWAPSSLAQVPVQISLETHFSENYPLSEYLTADACTHVASVESQNVSDLHATNNTGDWALMHLRIYGSYYAQNAGLTSTPVNVSGVNPPNDEDDDPTYYMRFIADGNSTDVYLIMGDTTNLPVDTYNYHALVLGHENDSNQDAGNTADAPVWVIQR